MNIKFNTKKLFSLKGTALALAAVSVVSLSGCGKRAECDIEGKHAHKYQDKAGYVRYIDQEYLSYEGYERHEDYKAIQGQEELYNYLDRKDLISIKDNLDLIIETQEGHKDFKEYRHQYLYIRRVSRPIMVGKVVTVMHRNVAEMRTSWTTHPEGKMLTGETRNCHYVYTAYKIEIDENGEYVLIPSPQVRDLAEVMEEFPYIKRNYYKVVDSKGRTLDYEDGRQEDLTEAEKDRIEDYYQKNPDQRPKVQEKGISYTKK